MHNENSIYRGHVSQSEGAILTHNAEKLEEVLRKHSVMSHTAALLASKICGIAFTKGSLKKTLSHYSVNATETLISELITQH